MRCGSMRRGITARKREGGGGALILYGRINDYGQRAYGGSLILLSDSIAKNELTTEPS